MPKFTRAPLSQPGWQHWPGCLFALAIVLLTVSGAGALFWQAPTLDIGDLWASRYLRSVVLFTLWQAFLSVSISVLLALPIARALDRHRNFLGRALLLRLMELSLVVPTIVAVSGLVSMYGRQGWLTVAIQEWLPSMSWNLYGLNGIVLAHVFFNAPLAARILLQALESAPSSQRRVASQLGLGSFWLWRSLEWPSIRPVLPVIVALVFTLCFTSFAIVMTLGGGPATSTIEVAIYQALRFEFDAGRAALLALIQLLICGTLWWLVLRKGLNTALIPDRQLFISHARPDAQGVRKLLDSTLLAAFVLFLTLPLLAVLARGLPGLADALMPSGFTNQGLQLLKATALSLGIALPAGVVSVVTSLLILGAKPGNTNTPISRLLETSAYLPLIIPPLVLATVPVSVAAAKTRYRQRRAGLGRSYQCHDGPTLCHAAPARTAPQPGPGEYPSGRPVGHQGLVSLALVTLAEAPAPPGPGACLRHWFVTRRFWCNCVVRITRQSDAAGAAVPATRQLSDQRGGRHRALVNDGATSLVWSVQFGGETTHKVTGASGPKAKSTGDLGCLRFAT